MECAPGRVLAQAAAAVGRAEQRGDRVSHRGGIARWYEQRGVSNGFGNAADVRRHNCKLRQHGVNERMRERIGNGGEREDVRSGR